MNSRKNISLLAAMMLAGVSVSAQAVTLPVKRVTVTGGAFSMGAAQPTAPAGCISADNDFTSYKCLTSGGTTPIVMGTYQGSVSGAYPANSLTRFYFFNGPVHSFTAASASGAASNYSGNTPNGTVDTVAGTISLDLGGWYANWNGTNFLQGTDPTQTVYTANSVSGSSSAAATGTYNSSTGTTFFSWHSFITTAPFSGQTGYWYINATVDVPPYVSAQSIAAGATGVDRSAPITVTFSEPVTGVSGSTLTLSTGGSPVAGTVSCDATPCTTARFAPTVTPLSSSTTYIVTLASTIVDANSNALVTAVSPFNTGYSYSFTTGTTASAPAIPTVSSHTEAATLTVNFDMAVSGVNTSSFTVSAGGSAVSGTVACNTPCTTATFTPSTQFSGGVVHTVNLTAAILSDSGGALVPVSWTFTPAAIASRSTPGVDTSTTVIVSTAAAGVSINALSIINAGTLEATYGALPTTPNPTGYHLDDGFVNFTADGVSGSATFTITFPKGIPSDAIVLKALAGGGYLEVPSSRYTISGNTLTITITDNEANYDASSTTGKIIDPIGILIPNRIPGAISGGAAGGGCAIQPNGEADFGLAGVLLLALGYAGYRRAKQ